MVKNIPTLAQNVTGWGNVVSKVNHVMRPEKYADIRNILKQKSLLLTRGQGCSYNDSAISEYYLISSQRLNKIICFDNKKGTITCEAGVTIAEILDIIIDNGWFFPTIPGTKKISIGGAIAHNIHGKNQYKHGEIINHINSITIMLDKGDIVTTNRQDNKDLFYATCGGLGLTGVILYAEIQLLPIKSKQLKSYTKSVKNIHEMISLFQEYYLKNSDYMIGWLDHFATNNNIGRGVFEAANHFVQKNEEDQSNHYSYKSKKTLNIPFFAPSYLLNKYNMAIYNMIRFHRYHQHMVEEIINFDSFFHPLDSIDNWNRLYGKRGFYQYQFLIPEHDNVSYNIADILKFIKDNKAFSYLAVIKYHRHDNALLSFSDNGYSIAMDFPNTKQIRSFLPILTKKIIAYDGKVYLAKDSFLTAYDFKKMYHEQYNSFIDYIKKFNPNYKFQSLLSNRLAITTPSNQDH